MIGVPFADMREQQENVRRRKLLFIAYPFPPLRATACVRTRNVAKYLTKLGWDVTVVTPDPCVWRNSEDPGELSIQLSKEGIQRLETGHRWRFLDPGNLNCYDEGLGWFVGGLCRRLIRWLRVDSQIGWTKPAELACASLNPNDVDVVLATGSPFSSFILAKRLSDRLGRPYVLDYRDPWTDNPHVTSQARVKTIEQERSLLADCTAAIVVSPSWAEAIDRRFSAGPKLHVITNGYDPEELASIKPYVFGHFAIVYAGGFYPPKRVITPVMAALKRLRDTRNGNGSDWYFHYFGTEEAHVREEAERFSVLDQVVLHGNVPRAEALSAVRGAGSAVVITTVDDTGEAIDRGIVPGKIFETMGLGVPFLLITPPASDAARIFRNCGSAGIYRGNDINGIAGFLANRMDDRSFLARNVDTYAWPNIVKQFDRVLRSVTEPAHA